MSVILDFHTISSASGGVAPCWPSDRMQAEDTPAAPRMVLNAVKISKMHLYYSATGASAWFDSSSSLHLNE